MKKKAWVARDFNGALFLFKEKPYKSFDGSEVWMTKGELFLLDSREFPTVSSEDKEPTEVEINIKIVKKG